MWWHDSIHNNNERPLFLSKWKSICYWLQLWGWLFRSIGVMWRWVWRGQWKYNKERKVEKTEKCTADLANDGSRRDGALLPGWSRKISRLRPFSNLWLEVKDSLPLCKGQQATTALWFCTAYELRMIFTFFWLKNIKKEEYFIQITWNSNLSVDKHSFIGTQPYSFTYILSTAAFPCQNHGAGSIWTESL